MGKIDEVKEFINYLKVLLALSLATEIGLLGWIANNYTKVDDFLLIGSIGIVLFLLIVIAFINKKIIKDIRSLKDL